jgi:hypothetical protein
MRAALAAVALGWLRRGLRRQPQAALEPGIAPAQVNLNAHVKEWYDFDVDRNGFITLPEVEWFFHDYRAPETEIKKIFSLMDEDDNGAVTWEEFNTGFDTEFFDWVDRTKDKVPLPEIEMVEDMYSRQYGNPYAAQRKEPPAEYNIRQEVRNDKPTKGMKYLEGYGWFEGEDPAVDEEYKGMIITPTDTDTQDVAPQQVGQKYTYSYGAAEADDFK